MSGFRFSDAVSSLQSSFSRRRSASQQSGSTSGEYTVDVDSLAARGTQDEFPTVDDAKLYALIPSLGLDAEADKRADEARRVVRLALDEMRLNWDLDPKTLGERSDHNRGCCEIARILARVRLQAPAGAALRAARGHTGDIPEDEAGGSRERVGEAGAGSTSKPARAYETHDLLKAIDDRNVELIMAIRDSNFDLLLDLGGGGASTTSNVKNNTPLGYAMGLGKDWDGICIVLTGALSRFVNQLPDPEQEDLSSHDATAASKGKGKKTVKSHLDPRTLLRLRKVRANLKLAIDRSLALEQTSLLASYCQVLNMSEGDTFVQRSIGAVQHALQARIVSGGSGISEGSVITSSDPFAVARQAVMQYVTEALRTKRDRIAAVEDYVANAVGDVVLMALWDAIRMRESEKSTLTAGEQEELHPDISQPLPIYFFARDDRVTSHFLDRVSGLHLALELLSSQTSAPKGVRNQRIWKRAQEVAEALSGSLRRLNSAERLEVLRSVIMR